MIHRAVVLGIGSVVLLSSASLAADPDPTADAALPHSGVFLQNPFGPVQPESKEEQAAHLRELRAMDGEAAEREVRTIAEEMQLDRSTEKTLTDITVQYSADSFNWGNSSPDFRDHGLAFARSLAARYDSKLASIRSLLGEQGLGRYQWCVAYITELQSMKGLEARLGPQDRLTRDQRAHLIRLLAKVNAEAMEKVDEWVATAPDLVDPTSEATTTTFQPDPRSAKSFEEASSFLSPTQLQALFSVSDEKAASADTVEFATSMSQIPGTKIVDVPIEPSPRISTDASTVQIAVQLDDGEPIVISHQPESDSRVEVGLANDLIAKLWIKPNQRSGASADVTVYHRTEGMMRRLTTMGTFGSTDGDATIMTQVIGGEDRAHILVTSIRRIP
jgi:hypothetical protein